MPVPTAIRTGHVERYVDQRTGNPILVRCLCELAVDHTYREWIESGQVRQPAQVGPAEHHALNPQGS